MNRKGLLTWAVTALALANTFAWAQTSDYPSRPIRLITPAQPGGTTDILARMFGIKLTEIFKQQIVVDNRASASGVIKRIGRLG